jgi:hypothetical protein
MDKNIHIKKISILFPTAEGGVGDISNAYPYT